MTERSASVQWTGSGMSGRGHMSTETGALQRQPYGHPSSIEGDELATDPEEILAAAHAACLARAFAIVCERAGFPATSVHAQAQVHLVKGRDGPTIDWIELRLQAGIADLDEISFQAMARRAKQDCPLSRALGSVPRITLEATLVAA